MLGAASFARAERRWDGARANEVSTGTGGGRIAAAGRGKARFREARARAEYLKLTTQRLIAAVSAPTARIP